MNIKSIGAKVIRRIYPIIEKMKNRVRLVQLGLNQDPNYLLPLIAHFQTTLGGLYSFQQKKPVDRNNQPLPWYTYPAIEYLNQFDFSKCAVFEYGSGNSSLFWGRRANSVTSVESDQAWYAVVKAGIPAGQKIIFGSDKLEYVNAIHSTDQVFDVVVVDGMWRGPCVVAAAKRIKTGGFIIFDNSDWFPTSVNYLRQNGFLQMDFIGFGPVNTIAWCTSIFLKGPCGIPRRADVDTIQVLDGIVQLGQDDTV